QDRRQAEDRAPDDAVDDRRREVPASDGADEAGAVGCGARGEGRSGRDHARRADDTRGRGGRAKCRAKVPAGVMAFPQTWGGAAAVSLAAAVLAASSARAFPASALHLPLGPRGWGPTTFTN